MRFLQFVLGTAAPDKPGKLRSTLMGKALADAVMHSGADPINASSLLAPSLRRPAALRSANCEAVGTRGTDCTARTLSANAGGTICQRCKKPLIQPRTTYAGP
jgi:hypothetical protein